MGTGPDINEDDAIDADAQDAGRLRSQVGTLVVSVLINGTAEKEVDLNEISSSQLDNLF